MISSVESTAAERLIPVDGSIVASEKEKTAVKIKEEPAESYELIYRVEVEGLMRTILVKRTKDQVLQHVVENLDSILAVCPQLALEIVKPHLTDKEKVVEELEPLITSSVVEPQPKTVSPSDNLPSWKDIKKRIFGFVNEQSRKLEVITAEKTKV